jgi:hypothetical protein
MKNNIIEEESTYEKLKTIFPNKVRITQKELSNAGIIKETTIWRRRKMNDLHLLPKFRKEGRRIFYKLRDIADFIDGTSNATDMN